MKGGPQTWDDFEKRPVNVTRACISFDGTRIAAVFADKTLCTYDATTGEVIFPPFKLDGNPWSVIFSRDGKLVASCGEALRLWNVETGEKVNSFDITSNVHSLAFSPDGTCIAAGCRGRGIDDEDSDGRGSYHIRVINLKLAKASYCHAHTGMPSGGEGLKLLKGEVPPSPFVGHEIDVYSVAYSPDGKQIASSSDDGVVRVWDVSTGESRTFNAYNGIMKGWTYPIAFSPDGTKLVSETTLINLSTGSCTPCAFHDRMKMVSSITFSADGRFLAWGSLDAVFQIWDTSTHQTIAQLVGHTGDVTSVDFFPDGKRIMSASADGTIRVWDVDSVLLEGPWEEMDDWGTDDSEMNWDGRIVGSDDKCIFFTPLPFRHARNTLVIGKCLTIDFSNFVYGDEWVKCREPL